MKDQMVAGTELRVSDYYLSRDLAMTFHSSIQVACCKWRSLCVSYVCQFQPHTSIYRKQRLVCLRCKKRDALTTSFNNGGSDTRCTPGPWNVITLEHDSRLDHVKTGSIHSCGSRVSFFFFAISGETPPDTSHCASGHRRVEEFGFLGELSICLGADWHLVKLTNKCPPYSIYNSAFSLMRLIPLLHPGSSEPVESAKSNCPI